MRPENPHPVHARAAVRALGASKIRELVNAGFRRKDVLPFWVGEPDEPTPEFIRRAGIASIEAGEVFYSHNLGLHRLREALAVGRCRRLRYCARASRRECRPRLCE